MLVEYMFGIWFLDFYIGIQWLWMDLEIRVWTNPTFGFKKSKKGVLSAFRTRRTWSENGKYAMSFYLSNLQNGLQELNRNAQGSSCMAKFLYQHKETDMLLLDQHGLEEGHENNNNFRVLESSRGRLSNPNTTKSHIIETKVLQDIKWWRVRVLKKIQS